MTFPRGERVRMTEALKAALMANGSAAHVAEFGECMGLVDGPVDNGNGTYGPDIDVRWQPSGLRYGYDPKWLEPYDDGAPRYPLGQIAPDDQGETELAIAVVHGTVVIRFPKPMTWLGFGPREARALGEALIRKAEEIKP